MVSNKLGAKDSIFTLMSLDELEKAVNGELLFDFAKNKAFSSVAIDSRNVESNSLFVPLRGEKQDGHIYIESALKNAAVVFFADSEFINSSNNKEKIESLCKEYSAACVCVENNLYALQDAAKYYLQKFPKLYKIGITGSNGKTTTKEILASIYSQKYNTIMNKGNFNSETGLPLSVFKVRPEHEVGIFELGMNRRGEIKELADVLFPNAAIITNIGTAHIGILGTKVAIAEEKKEVFSNFDEACFAVIPDCEYTDFLRDGVKGKLITAPRLNNLKTKSVKKIEELSFKGTKIFYKDVEISFPLIGQHNLQNALACIIFAEEQNFSEPEIKAGLESVQPLFGRSQLKNAFVSYLLDCYNANPESTMEAIRFCDSFEFENEKHFVLASMLELGDNAEEAHEKIFRRALESSANKIYFFGDEFAKNNTIIEDSKKELGKKVFLFNTNEFESLKNTLQENLSENDFVLLKGSRGLELERLECILQNNSEAKNV